jgi:hypothetical protein
MTRHATSNPVARAWQPSTTLSQSRPLRPNLRPVYPNSNCQTSTSLKPSAAVIDKFKSIHKHPALSQIAAIDCTQAQLQSVGGGRLAAAGSVMEPLGQSWAVVRGSLMPELVRTSAAKTDRRKRRYIAVSSSMLPTKRIGGEWACRSVWHVERNVQLCC